MKKVLILLQKYIDKLNSKLEVYLSNKYGYYVYDDIDPFINFDTPKNCEKELVYSDFWDDVIWEESDYQ